MGSGRRGFAKREDTESVRRLAQTVLDLEARRISTPGCHGGQISEDLRDTWLVLADALEEQGGPRARLRAFWARELATGRDELDWYKRFSVALGEQNVQGPSTKDPTAPLATVGIIPDWRIRSKADYERLRHGLRPLGGW